jgi:hypothetical protein
VACRRLSKPGLLENFGVRGDLFPPGEENSSALRQTTVREREMSFWFHGAREAGKHWSKSSCFREDGIIRRFPDEAKIFMEERKDTAGRDEESNHRVVHGRGS